MGKTYAVAPEGCEDYLTPGKMYETLNVDDDGFDVIDDDGDVLYCLWKGCAHSKGDWGRVDVDLTGVTDRDDLPVNHDENAETFPSGKFVFAKETQVGGDHYLKMKIQPLEFAMANELDACQTKIIKYICRDKSSKLEDLEKARHVLDYYIDWVKNNV